MEAFLDFKKLDPKPAILLGEFKKICRLEAFGRILPLDHWSWVAEIPKGIAVHRKSGKREGDSSGRPKYLAEFKRCDF